MLGGLLTLTALSFADAVFNRSRGAVQNLFFIIVTSASCVVMTGLPEVFFPGIPERALMVLKASMGPMSGAIALKYLGNWLGGMREDLMVHRITVWGSAVLFLGAIILALVAAQISPQDFRTLLLATAATNLVAVALGIVVSVRAAVLGDPLARWMVLACICLAAMTTGLYLRGLNVEGFGLGTWIFTASSTVAYFLMATVLIVMRNREIRQLARLAGLKVGADPATGLPTGSVLLSKVEHAFWRTGRINGECTVVCLYLRNLYELGEAAGHGVEHQILAAMAARIRRAAGFRCVVGLYHPLCFVVVFSSDKRPQLVDNAVARLRHLIAGPVPVVGLDGARHDFTPLLGMGVITLNPERADPLATINDAERQAMEHQSTPRRAKEDAIATVW